MTHRLYPTLWARLMANCTPLDNGCWQWTSQRSRSRYPQMSMRIAGKHRTARVHRIVAELVLGRPLTAEETIEHDCLNTMCICPHCMLLATPSDNSSSRQARHNGTYDHAKERMLPLLPKGEDNWLRGRFAHYAEPIPF